MNRGLLLNFWEGLIGIVELIPKVVYFLFTAFTSAIDAMQLLIRKLAGLDTYYLASTGEALTRKDPLSEFIYGILGIGNSSHMYKTLNTVFWSLAIFGLIMLVVSTIIAMVKSHYNEDQASTNPWKYIYTAIKSILTFAIIPLVMVFGLKLSNFVLVTLDNITQTETGTEEIKSIYGSDAQEIFVSANIDGTDDKTYIRYDFFGYGHPTNNTPLGSMVFKAAAASCNRSRSGQVEFKYYQKIEVGGKQIFGSSSCPEFSSLTSSEERQEYIAMQIDYAFSNNLSLSSPIKTNRLDTIFQGQVNYDGTLDLFKSVNGSFSKYNVSLVWFFYNLWTFNYIIAFGGGITLFGLLLSIIVGLMSRLIKGAALFLVYPALLGIAPLDNFKAFKSWGTNMLQQVMMAFGTIIGINIVLLLLPYMQDINFMPAEFLPINYIIQMVLLIVALIMAKDFITMVSGFVGGADAAAVGSGFKGDISSTVKKGASITGKIAGSQARIAGAAAVTVGRGAVKAGKVVAHGVSAVNTMRKGKKIEQMHNGEIEEPFIKNLGVGAKLDQVLADAKNETPTSDLGNIAKKARTNAELAGLDQEAQNAAARAAVIDYAKEHINEGTDKSIFETWKQQERAELKDIRENGSDGEKENADSYVKYRKAQEYEEDAARGKFVLKKKTLEDGSVKISGKLKKTSSSKDRLAFFRGVGTKMADEFKKVNLGKTIADGFAKSLGSLGEATGADKLYGGLKDIFKTSLTFDGGPYKESLSGDKLAKDNSAKQIQAANQQTEILKKISENMSEVKRAQIESKDILKRQFKVSTQPTAGNTDPKSGKSGS